MHACMHVSCMLIRGMDGKSCRGTYVCMYACMCASCMLMREELQEWMGNHAEVCMYVYVCMYVWKLCRGMYACICMYVCMYEGMDGETIAEVYMYVCVCMYV
jgi:hypothetical protein